jgi:hypothetical protein
LAVGDAHFARTCLESGVLRQSICHYQKRRATYRDIWERRARENQIDFIEGVAATALTPMAFLETVMVKSYETLVDSDTKVDVNTGIVAVGRLKSLIDSRDYSHDLLVMKVPLGQIADAVKSTVPQEMWGDVVQKLESWSRIRRRSMSERTPSMTMTMTMTTTLRSDRVHRRGRRVLTSAAPTVTDGDGDRCRCGRGVRGRVNSRSP